MSIQINRCRWSVVGSSRRIFVLCYILGFMSLNIQKSYSEDILATPSPELPFAMQSVFNRTESTFWYALPALPETRDVVQESLGVPDHYEFDVKRISSNECSGILRAVLELRAGYAVKAQKAFDRRLDRWMTASQMFALLAEWYSSEELMAAAYILPDTHECFSAILTSRGWTKTDVSSDEVGGTLASSEIRNMHERICNKLSLLSSDKQLQYLEKMLIELRNQSTVAQQKDEK